MNSVMESLSVGQYIRQNSNSMTVAKIVGRNHRSGLITIELPNHHRHTLSTDEFFAIWKIDHTAKVAFKARETPVKVLREDFRQSGKDFGWYE